MRNAGYIMPAVTGSFSLEALDNTLTKNRNVHEEINPRIATHFSQKRSTSRGFMSLRWDLKEKKRY